MRVRATSARHNGKDQWHRYAANELSLAGTDVSAADRAQGSILFVGEWAGENREAFELFQQGAEQADAANPAGDPKDNRFIDAA